MKGKPGVMRTGIGALVLLVSLLWGLGTSAPAMAQNGDRVPQLRDIRGLAQSNQLFQGDLRLERGQVIEGDAVVYDGNVQMDPGSRITGNLVVFDGDVNMGNGSVVDGNADLFSGDADIDGTIHGNLTLWSGDARLESAAVVMGNVSVLAGDINRGPEAVVEGQVLEGPNLNITPPSVPQPFGFNFRWSPDAPQAPVAPQPGTFITAVMAFFARVLGAILITGLVAVIVGLIVHVRPETVASVRTRIVDRTALTFVVGLAANLILGMLGGLLAVTICLLPIALAPILILLGINLLGWAALAQMVGQRLESYTLRKQEEWMWAGLGAVVLTAVFALLWAFGGPFRFLGNTILLLVSSFGAGAVLLPWVTRVFQPRPVAVAPEGRGSSQSAGQSAPQSQPAPQSMDAGTGAVPPAVAESQSAPGTGTLGAGTAYPNEPTTDVSQPRASAGTPVSEADAVELPPADLQSSETSTNAGETASDTTPDAAADGAARSPDDFTELRGVGPVLDSRLKEAGIRTFAQLAQLSAAEVAEIAGWPEARVTRSEIIEQARAKVGA